MDKWAEMQAFVEAVRLRSISAAGRHLGRSPSAVSKLLNRLEARLGVRLLNRSTRTLVPTEGGRAYLARCVEILTAIESAEDSMSGFGRVPAGTLQINSTPGFAKHQVLPLMPEFQSKFPDIRLQFQLTGQAIDLIAEGVDLAIRLGALKDTSLVARKIGESPRLVCASPGYVKRHGQPQSPSELRRHNCLRLSTHESFNRWGFSNRRRKETVEVEGNFITDNVDALHEYMLLGGGIGRLSAFMVARDIERGRLVHLLPDYDVERQQIHVVYPHRKHVPAKVRVFVDFLTDKLGGGRFGASR
jgi:DNA-binding transcriptional LysR family regulator